MSLRAILNVVCTVLGLSFVWPQVFRVFRVGSVEGISPRGQLHALSGGCLWSVYSFTKVIPPMMIVNTVVMAATAVVAVMMVKHRKMLAWQLIAVLVGFYAFGIGMAIISPAITAWFAIVIGATSIIPQTVYVMRHRNLAGVSMGMYGLLAINGVSWSLYGIVIHDLLVSAPNLILIPCAAVITVKAWVYQRGNSGTKVTADGELAVTS